MKKEYKIVTVCGAGVGSSNLLRTYVKEALDRLGMKATVENVGLSRAKSMNADLIITSRSFESMVQDCGGDVLVVIDLFDEDEISQKLEDYFRD